jgi:hypothetical protein
MDSNSLALLAAWAAVAVTLLVVWLQNRASKRLTCLQLFVQLAAQYDSADMQRARANLAAKLLADPTTRDISDTLLVFYENIAILHRRGLLDSELMVNTFSIDVRSYWVALQGFTEYARSFGGAYSDLYTEFERLNDFFIEEAKAKKFTLLPRQAKPLSEEGISAEVVREFLHAETLRGDNQMLETRPDIGLHPTADTTALKFK